MHCSGCGLQMSLEDNYCRRCGEPAPLIDVPVVASSARSLRVWRGAKPAVTQGVMLIAAGAMLRFLVGRAGRAILSRALSGDEAPIFRRMLPMAGSRSVDRGADEVEFIWYRRVRR